MGKKWSRAQMMLRDKNLAWGSRPGAEYRRRGRQGYRKYPCITSQNNSRPYLKTQSTNRTREAQVSARCEQLASKPLVRYSEK